MSPTADEYTRIFGYAAEALCSASYSRQLRRYSPDSGLAA